MDVEIQSTTARNETSLQLSQQPLYQSQIQKERTLQNKKTNMMMQEEIERRKKIEIIDMRKARSVPILDLKLSTLLSRRILDENLATTKENKSCSLNQLEKIKKFQRFLLTSDNHNCLIRKNGKSEKIKEAEKNQIKKN